MPLSWFSGSTLEPANLTTTYFSMPLESLGSAPPKRPELASPSLEQPAVPPSAPSGQSLIGALPLMTKPPHRPRSVVALPVPIKSDSAVSVIGAFLVPRARICEPREMTRKSSGSSPKMVEPDSMSSTAESWLSPPITTLPSKT